MPFWSASVPASAPLTSTESLVSTFLKSYEGLTIASSVAASNAQSYFSSVNSENVLFRVLVLLATPTIIFLSTYLVPEIYMMARPVPNLKEKYNAEWALVTGGGSGIGKALCFALASQGLNVVVVSLDDAALTQTMSELSQNYPALQFRSVPTTFSSNVNYMDKIIKATKDITVQCVFNNAGFIVTGFFEQAPLGKHLANLECNASSTVPITHHFLKQMTDKKLKGCVVFTSSVAGFIPTPFAAMYASTKAFVSQFACCCHIEVYGLGIDVCAVHPSPVASNFYDKVDHKIKLMEAAQKSAVPPSDLPNQIFKSIGACATRDIGGMALGTRIGTFFLPYNFFTRIFAVAAPFLPDYKKHNANRK